ncbi:MAG: ERCC4 domain-containing protein [Candidatus Micrarchaeia archaeon]
MVKIIVDNRERNFLLIEKLSELAELEFSALPVGDYILSDRICIERKSVADFENSIMNGRLFDQVERLKESFPKPVLILEGDGSEYRLSSNVILGAMLKLYIDYDTQVILSANEDETAEILYMIAKREQENKERLPRIAGMKRAYSEEEWQRLVLASLPGVGPKIAEEMLRRFKSIKNVANASIEELMHVDKIGKKKATKIYEILNLEYK